MMQKITVKNGLTLFVETDSRVKRFFTAGRHQASQKGNDRRRHRVIHHEVDIGEFEQAIQSLGAEDDGVCVYRSFAIVQ